MTKIKIYLLLFIALFGQAFSKLKITGPSELKKQLSDTYAFAMSKYGKIPYGSTQIGTLVLAEPLNGCSSLQKIDEKISKPIFVIQRGDCPFTTKSRYAQSAGAKLVLIVDNQVGPILIPFGTANEPDIIIPSIVVEKKVGDKIINFMKNNKEEISRPEVSIKFPIGEFSKDNKVDIEFWFSSSDSQERVYSFIHDLGDQLSGIQGATITPHYITILCDECTNSKTFTSNDEDCLSGGRYCAPDPDKDGPLTGADVVFEDLRQICIFKQSQDLWWSYIDSFSKDCLNKSDEKDCGDSTLRSVGASDSDVTNINTCMEDSFKKTAGKSDPKKSDNILLAEERRIQQVHGISSFPALLINGRQYNEKLKVDKVFKSVCENFVTPPEGCKGAQEDIVQPETDYEMIFLVILILLFLTGIIFYFYRRMAKREMTQEMSIQISQMVSQYFTLNDEADPMRKRDGA